MQRLASLPAANPDGLEIRARRAALNRQVGNRVEAGLAPPPTAAAARTPGRPIAVPFADHVERHLWTKPQVNRNGRLSDTDPSSKAVRRPCPGECCWCRVDDDPSSTFKGGRGEELSASLPTAILRIIHVLAGNGTPEYVRKLSPTTIRVTFPANRILG